MTRFMSRRSYASITLAVVAMTYAGSALAKQPAPAPSHPAAPAPAPAAPAGPDAPTPTPDVNDSMLTTVPPAAHTLTSWKEALSIINSRDADLRTALLEIVRARGAWREALAPALPQISAQGSITLQLLRTQETILNPLNGMTQTTTAPPSPVEDASITITQAILAPRVWYGIGTAERQIDFEKLSADDVRRTLVANVAIAIVGVVTAEQVAQINRVGLKAALGTLALQQRKVTLGAGANLDLVRFQQDANAARATLVTGDEQLRQAREKLGLALGSQEAWGVPSDIKLDDIQAEAEKTCKPGALEDRPDIRALHKTKEINERAVTDVDLQYIPTADISTTLLGSSEQLAGTNHVTWNVMGVLNIPIWDGGARYGAHRIAKAQVEETDEKIAAAERNANVQITQADRGVAVALDSEKLAEEARDLAKENDRLVRLAFDGGAATSFDLVTASSTLRQAELNLRREAARPHPDEDHGRLEPRELYLLSRTWRRGHCLPGPPCWSFFTASATVTTSMSFSAISSSTRSNCACRLVGRAKKRSVDDAVEDEHEPELLLRRLVDQRRDLVRRSPRVVDVADVEENTAQILGIGRRRIERRKPRAMGREELLRIGDDDVVVGAVRCREADDRIGRDPEDGRERVAPAGHLRPHLIVRQVIEVLRDRACGRRSPGPLGRAGSLPLPS